MAKMRKGQKARFEIDGTDIRFPGYDLGLTWNGWAVPFVTEQQLRKAIIKFSELDSRYPYSLERDGDEFVMHTSQPEDVADTGSSVYAIFDPEVKQTEEGSKTLYRLDLGWVFTRIA